MQRSQRSALFIGVGAALLAGSPLAGPALGATDDTVRVSVASNEAGGGLPSWLPSISADGRFVAFSSQSPNLVVGDSGDGFDIFVRDRRAGTTELVSVTADGSPAGLSEHPAISADGAVVAFVSSSPDLVPGDSNADWDVFVRDRVSGVSERLTDFPVEAETNWSVWGPAISADGRYVAYSTTRSTWNSSQGGVYVHDRLLDVTHRVGGLDEAGQGHDSMTAPTISADGNVVAYRTYRRAAFLSTEQTDSAVLVHDRTTGETEDVDGEAVDREDSYSVSEPPSLSADGRFVAFASGSADLVADDDNGVVDVFVHDRLSGTAERISGDPASSYSLSPTLSSDGRYGAFQGATTSSSDEVYVHDRATGATRLVSGGDPTYSDAETPVFAGDGRYLAFVWEAPRLDRWDTDRDRDVFVHDLVGGSDPFDPDAPGTVPCPDATSASVTCSLDRQGRMVLDGTWRDETLVGTGSADTMRAGRGADFLTARGGADRLYGEQGADALKSGGGTDRLFGGSGGDLMEGGSRRDVFFAGRGADRIDSGGQRLELVDCGAGDSDRVRGARADRVRADCEGVRKFGGYSLTDANAYSSDW